MSSQSSVLPAPPLDRHQRANAERKRLWRILRGVSHEPTEKQTAKFKHLMKNIRKTGEPSDESTATSTSSVAVSRLHHTMNPITMTCDNIHRIDATDGVFTVKIDGINALVAWTSTVTNETDVDRRDTMVYVSRENILYAVDHMPLFFDTKQAVFEAEWVLCKKRMSMDEIERNRTGFDIHSEDYLDYPTYLDADALAKFGSEFDLACDAHQAQYDHEFELCCVAFDCLWLGLPCASLSFMERIKFVKEVTETPFVQLTVACKKRLVQVSEGVKHTGGADKITARFFLKPMVQMNCIGSAFHALPPCLFGMRTDGLVFYRGDVTYEFGFSEGVMKWKPLHCQSVDGTLIQYLDEDGNTIMSMHVINRNGAFKSISTHILDDTETARSLISKYTNTQAVLRLSAPNQNAQKRAQANSGIKRQQKTPHQREIQRQNEQAIVTTNSGVEKVYVLEFEPVIIDTSLAAPMTEDNFRNRDGGITNAAGMRISQAVAQLDRSLWWRPVMFREEKSWPNAVMNFESVYKALLYPVTKEMIVAQVKAKLTRAKNE